MNILISGGLGYLGSFLANNLSSNKSNKVVILDPGLFMPTSDILLLLQRDNVFFHKTLSSEITKEHLSCFGSFDLTIDASGLSNDAVCNQLPDFVHRFNVEEPLKFIELSAC